jgi:hypothetical protein
MIHIVACLGFGACSRRSLDWRDVFFFSHYSYERKHEKRAQHCKQLNHNRAASRVLASLWCMERIKCRGFVTRQYSLSALTSTEHGCRDMKLS